MRKTLFVILCLLPIAVTAQNDGNEYEKSWGFDSKKIDLNLVTSEELKEFNFISEFQVKSILHYRKTYNGFSTVYELQFVLGISDEEFAVMKELFFVKSEIHEISYFKGNYIETVADLRKTSEYSESVAITDEVDLSLKHRLQYKIQEKFIIRSLFEKDRKEAMNSGYDYNSFSVEYKPNKNVKIVLGDYLCSIGQGLAISNSSSFFYEKTEPYKKRQILKGNSSFLENNAFRGAGINAKHRTMGVRAIYSSRKYDSRLSELGFTGLDNTGLHTDSASLSRKHNLSGEVIVVNPYLSMQLFETGIVFCNVSFDKDFSPINEYTLINNNQGSGGRLSHYYKVCYEKVDAWGESAIDWKGNYVMVHGLNYELTGDSQFCLQMNWYSPEYIVAFTNGFSSHATNANEKGVFVSFQNKSLKNINLTPFFHSCSFPAERYLIESPSRAVTAGIKASCLFADKSRFDIRYHAKDELNEGDENNNYSLNQERKHSFRFHYYYPLNQDFHFDTRFEFGMADETVTGSLFYSQFAYVRGKTKVAARFTKSNNSNAAGIYTYELDVPSTFYIPSYSGKGTGCFAYFKTRLTRRFDFAAKVGLYASFKTQSQFRLKTYLKIKV